MKIAFVFPGQGSQSVGMLKSLAAVDAVANVLERASAALGQDLARLIAEGPVADLGLTVNTQPCMLAAGVACYAAWRAAGGDEPAMMAGHSLGEYSALTAAGVFELGEVTRLVRFRAEAMQQAVPVGSGTMAAILGLDDDAVRAACAQAARSVPGETVEAVNFNAPMQVVIAGHTAAVERACAAAIAAGARRAVVLPVSAPFHSSLLAPASAALRERLKSVNLAPPVVPVINNVDAAIESEPARIVDALARQAASPVRWVEIIRGMAADGVSHVVECGPGRVLAGLTRRIEPALESLALFDAASLHQCLERLRR